MFIACEGTIYLSVVDMFWCPAMSFAKLKGKFTSFTA